MRDKTQVHPQKRGVLVIHQILGHAERLLVAPRSILILSRSTWVLPMDQTDSYENYLHQSRILETISSSLIPLTIISTIVLCKHLDGIQYPPRDDQYKFLVCPCVEVYRGTSIISSSLVNQQYIAFWASLTWMVCEMGCKWPYIYCF